MRPPYAQLKRRGPKLDAAVVLGRKFCSRCGRWRQLCDFSSRRGLPHAYCRGCERARRRESYRNSTAQSRERRREYDRIYGEAKRRQAGVAPRPIGRPSIVDEVEEIYVHTGPLVAELERALAAGGDLGAICELASISQRQLWRWRNGEHDRTRLDLADRLADALDVPLALLYGDDDVIYGHPTRPETRTA